MGACWIGGGDCCANTGTVQHITAASVTVARREAEIMKGTPWS
jgi:hypothetical protein